jgi:hypothetical protein
VPPGAAVKSLQPITGARSDQPGLAAGPLQNGHSERSDRCQGSRDRRDSHGGDSELRWALEKRTSGDRARPTQCLVEAEIPGRMERRDHDSQRSPNAGNVKEELLGGAVEQEAVALPVRVCRVPIEEVDVTA